MEARRIAQEIQKKKKRMGKIIKIFVKSNMTDDNIH